MANEFKIWPLLLAGAIGAAGGTGAGFVNPINSDAAIEGRLTALEVKIADHVLLPAHGDVRADIAAMRSDVRVMNLRLRNIERTLRIDNEQD